MRHVTFVMKRVAMAVALGAGPLGIACADDSSLNPFTGDSYAYLNGGTLGAISKPPVYVQTPSAWRLANPDGLSIQQFQTMSSEAWGYAAQKKAFDRTPSSYAQTHPAGLSVVELQALSSWAPAWHPLPQHAPRESATVRYSGSPSSSGN